MTDDPASPGTLDRKEAGRPQRVRGGQPKRGLQAQRAPDYVLVGHICADILPDGTAVLGGTALYSALTVAALGWRVGVLTRGRYGVTIDGVAIPDLGVFSDRVQVIVQDAEWPTFFVNEYVGGRRNQQITRWAGPIDLRGLPPHWHSPRVLHLGPIAQEIDVRQAAGLQPRFLGVTPQGWMRDWPRATGGRVQMHHLRLPKEFLSTIDGIVVNDEELVHSRDSIEMIGRTGYGVVTLGISGAQLYSPGGMIEVPAFDVPVFDPTGAGDVFTAAFFYRIADPSVTAEAALNFANAAAGLSLAGVGASVVPSRAAIKRLIDQVASQR